jgi:hypothetical protein
MTSASNAVLPDAMASLHLHTASTLLTAWPFSLVPLQAAFAQVPWHGDSTVRDAASAEPDLCDAGNKLSAPSARSVAADLAEEKP